ncbi:hypothetical protein AAY86_04375 [Pseudomonas amygdali pv. tabaci str. ATCC 11528]|uniref:DUF6861 domain-containing protein n=1 Tax=Pseudomonas syringae group TaxID=136849 RepID=UPI0001BC91FE|nr:MULTISPECIES: glycine zipper family protein [Pseudomonas syringae group]KEZ65614.1 hypothetical protein C1E_0222150 [Pseudomonas amygdali pv. tabaci str. ATCC 11528]KKY53982.1 hypothetical protein AAY86_04375 [Pseudomonas amygdali pv. tabaci str. ATCC 11528]MDU8648592.1 glycine zipper family protein [Pseudomonas syringae group sp. 26L6]QED84365.1 glycine zipper family protein [Pseudomonas amygdali pv. tabaci str. ATCC 11528]
MDLLANVPKWDDIERTLDNKFNHLNQSFDQGWESAFDGWNGFTRRVSNEATLAFGSIGGNRIESVKLAMAKSYPIIQLNLMRKWASIDITEILPVLLQLVKEVAMIMGGSVAVGTLVGGAAGSLAFGAGAVPGAIAGSGIGLQVGNLILLGMGLSAIADYFYQGLPACLATLYEGMVTAWNAEEGVKPPGLDPTGASAWLIDERIDAAARQLARGQEQLVMLLLTAIVTYITRGQIKAGIVGSLDGIAARSAKLQADMTNKQIAGWLARNEQKLLAHPELRRSEPSPLRGVMDTQEPPTTPSPSNRPDAKKESNDVANTSSKPEWLQRLDAGNEFNRVQSKNYPYNEVYIQRPDGNGYYRLDSYNPTTGEIISRKLTQFSKIYESTAKSYINEAISKYPSGSTIANVPSSGSLAGQKLQGALILEVPPQTGIIPQTILDSADKAGVLIRDINGKVY